MNLVPTTPSGARWPTSTTRPSAPGRARQHPLYKAAVASTLGGGADVVLSGHEHNYERFAPQNPGGRTDPERGTGSS